MEHLPFHLVCRYTGEPPDNGGHKEPKVGSQLWSPFFCLLSLSSLLTIRLIESSTGLVV